MEEPKCYSIENLNELSHYRPWSQVIESHLNDQDLWEIVSGKVIEPEKPTATSTSTAQTTAQAPAAEAGTEAAMEEYERKLKGWTKKAKNAIKETDQSPQ